MELNGGMRLATVVREHVDVVGVSCEICGNHHYWRTRTRTRLMTTCQRGSSTVSESQREARWPSHHIDDELAETLALPFGEVLKDVTVFLVKKLEAHSQVVVLQH